MTTTAYTLAVKELRRNEEQWQAYESKGNCVVLAGPGSGKTKVLTVKIARLLHEEVRAPRGLACITYSNACVDEILTRLQKLGVRDDDRLSVSTVHSFCLRELVLPYARLAGVYCPDPLKVASPTRSRELFEKAYAQTLGGRPPRWFRIEFDKLRRTVLDRSSNAWKAWPGRETEVVETYEALLVNEDLIDFDGIVLAGLELAEKHDWICRCIKAKYPIVVIDEYQDLGLPLHRMILALMRKAAVRIIAVGDPDQSIYGFTGAQPGLLRTLKSLPGIEPVHLKLNYRCADKIIAASKTLLADPTEFKSHDRREGLLKIYKAKRDVREQALYVFGTLVPALLKENPSWSPGDIAMLYRTLNEGTPIAEAADAIGVRYFRVDNGAPIKRSRLIDWLMDASKWCAGGWQSGTVSLGRLLKSWRLMRASIKKESELLTARKKLISVLFANRDGSISLQQWLEAVKREVLEESCSKENRGWPTRQTI